MFWILKGQKSRKTITPAWPSARICNQKASKGNEPSFHGAMTSVTLMQEEPSTGWHRKWLLLMVLLLWGFLCRFRLMGMLLAHVVRYQLRKKMPRIKLQVDIHHVLLSPLQFVHVEVRSDCDWRALFTRITVKSNVRTFFRSFGQSKIMILSIDAVIGDLERVDEEFLRKVVKWRNSNEKSPHKAATASDETSKPNPAAFLRFVDFRIGLIQLKMKCFGSKNELSCRDFVVGIDEVRVNQSIYCLKVEASFVLIRSSRSKSQAFNSDALRDIVDDGVQLDLPDISMVFDVTLCSSNVVGLKWFGSNDSSCKMHICTAYIEWLAKKRAQLIRDGLIPIPASLDVSSGKLDTPIIIELTNIQLSIIIVHDSANHGPLAMQLSVDVDLYHLVKKMRRTNKESSARNSTSLEYCDQIKYGCLDKNCHVVLRNISASGGRDFSSEFFVLTFCEVQTSQVELDRTKWNCHLGHVGVVMTPKIAQFIHSMAEAQNRIKQFIQKMSAIDKEGYDDKTTITQKTDLRNQSDINILVASWKVKISIPSENDSFGEMTLIGKQTSVDMVVIPTNIGVPTTKNIKVDEVNIDIHAKAPDSYRIQSLIFSDLNLSITNCATTQKISSTKLVHLKSLSINHPDNKRSTTFPVAYFQDVNINRVETIENNKIDVNTSIMITNADIKWSHNEHRKVLAEWKIILRMLEEIELMSKPTPGISSHEPRTLTSNTSNQKSAVTSVQTANGRLHLIKIQDIADSVTFMFVNSKGDYQKNGQGMIITFICDHFKAIWNELYIVFDISSFSFIQKNALDFQHPLSTVPTNNSISANQLKLFLAPGSRLLLLFLQLDDIAQSKGEIECTRTQSTPSHQVVTFICTKLYIAVYKEMNSATSQCFPIYDATLEALSLNVTLSKSLKLSCAISRVLNRGLDGSILPAQLSERLKHVMETEGVLSVSTISIRNYNILIAEILSIEIRLCMTQIQYMCKLSTNWPEIIFDWSSLATQCQLNVEENSLNHLISALTVIKESMSTREDTELKNDANGNWRSRYVCNIDAAFAHWSIDIPYGHACDLNGPMKAHLLIHRIALNIQQWRKMAIQYTSLRVALKEAAGEETNNSLPLQICFLPQTTVTSTFNWKKTSSSAVTTEFETFSLALELRMRGILRSDPNATVPIQENALVSLDWDYVYPLLISLVTKTNVQTHLVSATETSQAREIQSTKQLRCTGVQWDVSLDAFQMSWWDGIMQDTGILVVFNDFLSHGILTSLPLKTTNHPTTIDCGSLFLWETTMYSDLIRSYLVRESTPENLRVQENSSRSTNESNFYLEMTGISYRFTNQEYSGVNDEMEDIIAAQFSKWDSVVICKLHEQFYPLEYDFTMCAYSQTKMTQVAANSCSTGASSESTPASRLSPQKTSKGWTQTVRNKLMRLKRRTSSMDNLLINDGSCPIQVDSMKLLWTIETRDCSFYVISVVVDSVRLLIEAKHQLQMDDVQLDSAVNGLNESRRETQSNTNIAVDEDGNEVKKRKQSARDSLLELLQQGKLGQNETCLSDQDDIIKSENRGASRSRESSDRHSEKTIIFKKYTLDVHDAQINMHEENSGSSVLIASKHIHLEFGLDENRSNAITTLRFDHVTAHVAPIDVDITAGVLWYSYSSGTASSLSSRENSSSQSSSSLLKKIMEECSLTTFYTLTLATGASSVEADLSFMQLSTDRHQFYQLLNVIRHVLLAPPALSRRPTRAQTTHINMQNDSASYAETSDTSEFSPTSPSIHGNYSKKLHAQLADEIRNREARFLGSSSSRSQMIALKCISFSVSGAQIRLQCSPEITGVDHEFVEIRVEQLTGSHTYYVNQCTKLTLNMQWLEINNLRPGPSSIAFEDPTSVLRAKLLVGKHFQGRSRLDLTNQKGMLTIRAESGPLMRVLGQKLRVLDVLEVSIFPEISNQIVIQLASDFYDLLYKFFFERMPVQERNETNCESVLFGRKGATSTTQVISSTQSSISPMVRGRLVQPLGQVHPGSPSMHARRKSLVINTSSYDLSTNTGSSGRNLMINSPNTSEYGEDEDTSAEGDELFYFKYVRIGNIRLGINCNGFFVNLNDFDLDLPPYVCQSKLATWKRLLQKFESHLKWHLTRESASSGLSHFKNKFLKWTPSGSISDKKDKARRDADEEQKDEGSAAANAQVLFGPYSGSAT